MLTFILMMEDGEKKDMLERLYIEYNKELFYVAYQILNNYHDAQDVLQDAFIRISKHLDKISKINCKKTRAYLVIIVRNLSFDRYNEKKRSIPTDFAEEGADLTAKKISLEEHVLHLELGKDLAKAMSRINTGYADILTLKYYYEYDNTQIGELINMSSENVSVRLCRAKAALKKILSEGGVGNEQ
ncbi:MAG TPA: sigma-70 family RNA polymerase sigma factor [Mobilitalea sp.]|nr:sigma-70 family RNA polymerase sigma factor [Mobilitalea sp.]